MRAPLATQGLDHPRECVVFRVIPQLLLLLTRKSDCERQVERVLFLLHTLLLCYSNKGGEEEGEEGSGH